MKRIVTLTVLFTLILLSARSQVIQPPFPEQLFGNFGEIYFKFTVGDKDLVNTLTKVVSIDNVEGNVVYAYANRQEFSSFLAYGLDYTILPHPGTLLDPSELRPEGSGKGPLTTWNFYPTYQEYLDFMAAFANNYPEICRLDTIGTTVQGRLLLSLKISDNVNQEEAEPQFFYASSLHGDELTGYVLMLHLIDYLLSNYNSNAEVTDMINSMELYITPLSNPDGTYKGGNNSVYGAQRYNANNVDLNRNYPDPADGPHPDGNAWQPETVAFMAFADSNHLVMAANFHGGTSVLNYPWDTWARLTADNEWWKHVCREYVDTVHLYGPSGYYSGYDNGITNGYAWYRITGGMQDYMNYFKNCRMVTNEISDIKLLPASQLLNYWSYNYRSLINYIQEGNLGVQGIVTDTLTGEPLKAKLTILGHDQDNSFVYSSLPTGHYSRLLYEGTYNLTFTSAGYFSKVITNVNVVNGQQTPLDVRMVPLNISAGPVTVLKTPMSWPNPSSGIFNVRLPFTGTGTCTAEVFDMTGRNVYKCSFPEMVQQFTIDLTGCREGLYLLKVKGTAGVFEDRLIRR